MIAPFHDIGVDYTSLGMPYEEYPYDETMQFDEFGSELESYQEGGEYELSDEEIDEIIRNGGEIEFI